MTSIDSKLKFRFVNDPKLCKRWKCCSVWYSEVPATRLCLPAPQSPQLPSIKHRLLDGLPFFVQFDFEDLGAIAAHVSLKRVPLLLALAKSLMLAWPRRRQPQGFSLMNFHRGTTLSEMATNSFCRSRRFSSKSSKAAINHA
jgi:hypothetical protein